MIPTIDINSRTAPQQLHSAFTTVGFAYVQGLPSSGKPFQDVLKSARELFALPDNDLMSIGFDLETNSGFERLLESFKPGTPPDLHEAMTWGPDRPHDHIWPNEHAQAAAVAWTACCRESMTVMIGLLEQALEQPSGSLLEQHQGSTTSTLRWIRYPAWTGEILPGQTRGGEHTDLGTLTLLHQDQVPGLEVCTRDCSWIPAPAVPGACLVNVGDMLQRWTNDVYVSTPHRVSNVALDRDRLSFPYFVHPRPEVTVGSLIGTTKYRPINARKYFDRRLARSYRQQTQL